MVPRRLRARFPDEAARPAFAAKRWRDGFVCPPAAMLRGWGLKRRRASWECTACGKETSVTAGDHATQPLAPEAVRWLSHRDQPLERYAASNSAGSAEEWLLRDELMVPAIHAALEDLAQTEKNTVKDPPGGQRSPQARCALPAPAIATEPRRIRPMASGISAQPVAFVAKARRRARMHRASGYTDHASPRLGATQAASRARGSIECSNLKRWSARNAWPCGARICAAISPDGKAEPPPHRNVP